MSYFGAHMSLEVDDTFDSIELLGISITDGYSWTNLTVNQVKDLMSHLQRALDEHGDRT